MNRRQVPGDVLPGVGHIFERMHGRGVWSYRPSSSGRPILPNPFPESASLIIMPDA